jgi:hypothetical protein
MANTFAKAQMWPTGGFDVAAMICRETEGFVGNSRSGILPLIPRTKRQDAACLFHLFIVPMSSGE